MSRNSTEMSIFLVHRSEPTGNFMYHYKDLESRTTVFLLRTATIVLPCTLKPTTNASDSRMSRCEDDMRRLGVEQHAVHDGAKLVTRACITLQTTLCVDNTSFFSESTFEV